MPNWSTNFASAPYAVIFAILFPMAFFCILPLLAAVIGGMGRPALRTKPVDHVAGYGDTTRGIVCLTRNSEVSVVFVTDR